MKSKYIFIAACLILGISCEKFLDKTSDASLTVPSNLTDAQALLDRSQVMNIVRPSIGEGSADDYFLFDADFASISTDGMKNNYTWGDELFYNNVINDWYNVYQALYIAQLSIETLSKIDRTASNASQYDDIVGQAYFHRASFYHIAALLWAKAYDPSYAASAPGIPLRGTTDFNQPTTRASLQETYERIESDLLIAIKNLPVVSAHLVRPSKPAAYALLARVYLSMGSYEKAGRYADSSLQLKNDLLDYNTVSATPANPFAQFNKEVIFVSDMPVPSLLSPSRAFIDSNLYASYAVNDLRRSLFFKDNGAKKVAFRGSYFGNSNLLTGPCVDEVILMRAECSARAGNKDSAMNDLNRLLKLRWKTGTYTNMTATTPQDALAKILTERRKELVMRDLRWMDLKRLNRESAFAITIRRKINGQLLELPPNSPRYALPIPDAIIQISGIPQNER